ncbi:MAG: AI-2E family transporter [Ruminococcaceae bacterium]|nr:AI-2E family transporter [Oscillospiraceae bacterium]
MFNKEGKKSILSIASACAVFFVIFYLLINISAIGGVFSSILSVFTPIILGFTFAYMLNPILKLFEFKVFKKMQNKKLLRALSIVLTYVFAIVLIVAFGFLIIPALVESITDLADKMDSYLISTAQYVNSIIVKFTKNNDFAEYISTEQISDTVMRFFSFSGDVFDTVMAYIAKYGPALFSGLKNAFLGLFISIYILISKERLKAQSRKLSAALLKTDKRKRFRKYLRIAHRTFGNFFVGKSIESLSVLFICLIIFSLFGIPYAPLVSVIVGAANFIPVFGPFLGAIPSFAIIFIADPKKALIFVILVLIIQILDGNVIGPKMLGETTGISSISVIVSIVIGGYFGVIGMIVAVPIFATVTAIVKDLADTRLKKAELPTDIAKYYASDSLVDPHEQHETISQRIFRSVSYILKKAAKLFTRKNKKTQKAENDKSEETEENDN